MALGRTPTSLPLANVEVTIKSKKGTFTFLTDGSGKFVFKDIPPAEYKITAKTPTGLAPRTFINANMFPGGSKPNAVSVGETIGNDPVRLDSAQKPKYYFHHWDSYNFIFTSLSSIEGKVVGLDGKIPPQQFLWLLPVDKGGKSRLDDPIQYLWADHLSGKFVFENIPSGKYRIATNPCNCHSDRNPQFSRNFFPGVSEDSEADTITVGENQKMS
ncbi:MAG: carboxypeptidase-like regulatory domain-containing protein [Acidobacteriota bacterium]